MSYRCGLPATSFWLAISAGDGLIDGESSESAVLLLSVRRCARALRQCSRGKLAWSAFAFSLPILPVVPTAAVLADIYYRGLSGGWPGR